MMVPPPVTDSPLKNKSHAASLGAIMNELGHTKSRIFKVAMLFVIVFSYVHALN